MSESKKGESKRSGSIKSPEDLSRMYMAVLEQKDRRAILQFSILK